MDASKDARIIGIRRTGPVPRGIANDSCAARLLRVRMSGRSQHQRLQHTRIMGCADAIADAPALPSPPSLAFHHAPMRRLLLLHSLLICPSSRQAA